ncbi:hypothetical protein RB597_008253 [Gaeumannomyces tritici]
MLARASTRAVASIPRSLRCARSRPLPPLARHPARQSFFTRPQIRAASTTSRSSPPLSDNGHDTSESQRHGANGGRKRTTLLAGATGASLLAAIAAVTQSDFSSNQTKQSDGQNQDASADGRDPSLPRHRLADIRVDHGPGSDRPWVTYQDKVYDITDWVGAHPGGDVILRAAGASIEPYWDIFTIHKAPHVREILDQYLVGLIAMEDLDRATGLPVAEAVEDPFATDPARDPRLITHTAKPRNAEPPASELAGEFVTPAELFYVRNHMWVPPVEAAAAGRHALTIELPSGEERVYTLEELRSRFRVHRVTAALQCSGNRRSDMTASANATNGLQWGVGAISNAEWEGVRLADVLLDAGLSPTSRCPTAVAAKTGKDDNDNDNDGDDNREMHVQFSALEAYGASIPLSTALDPRADVLLAFGMNGRPLPPDHGFPLRAIVPGHVAARSVKWLSRIAIADEESTSQWQRRDYKCFGPNEGSSPDWDRYPAIQEMPITSAVTGIWVGGCVREAGKKARWMLRRTDEHRAAPGVRDLSGWRREHHLDQPPPQTAKSSPVDAAPATATAAGDETVPVALMGYAYSGGGKAIIRVDVSVDGGRTWDQAELLDDCGPDGKGCRGSKAWAWRRWRYVGNLPEFAGAAAAATKGQDGDDKTGSSNSSKCTTVLVKATDSAYNTQPENHTGIYNVRGNLATAWHRVLVCPSCTKTSDGRTAWRTGSGVFGAGFAKGRCLEGAPAEGTVDKKRMP